MNSKNNFYFITVLKSKGEEVWWLQARLQEQLHLLHMQDERRCHDLHTSTCHHNLVPSPLVESLGFGVYMTAQLQDHLNCLKTGTIVTKNVMLVINQSYRVIYKCCSVHHIITVRQAKCLIKIQK